MNHKLTKDNKGMVVLTQKDENENLIKNIFRVTGVWGVGGEVVMKDHSP